MTDTTDLGAPLTRRRLRARVQLPVVVRRLPIARLAFGLIAVIVGGAALRIALVHDPDGGRPSTTVAVNASPAKNAIADTNSAGSGAPAQATITVGPEIPADEAGIGTSPATSTAGSATTPSAASPTGALPDLVEQTEFGPIPRVSAIGLRPFEAYAPPVNVVEGTPQIAIIVTGLGLNADGTRNAIGKLPANVTLAFAPYGKTLQKLAGEARTGGHELFLEVPLEPFDYPDNDPGPDTLLTGQAPRDNLNRLFKVMSRFPAYVGIVNNMGARFTSSGADFGPVMEELGSRGLGYLDDGSSNRSLAPQLAKANQVPFGHADITLDADPSRGAILDQLDALETLAKSNGSAVGIVSALPVSIDTIAEWAGTLMDQGIELVPASALMKE